MERAKRASIDEPELRTVFLSLTLLPPSTLHMMSCRTRRKAENTENEKRPPLFLSASFFQSPPSPSSYITHTHTRRTHANASLAVRHSSSSVLATRNLSHLPSFERKTCANLSHYTHTHDRDRRTFLLSSLHTLPPSLTHHV